MSITNFKEARINGLCSKSLFVELEFIITLHNTKETGRLVTPFSVFPTLGQVVSGLGDGSYMVLILS